MFFIEVFALRASVKGLTMALNNVQAENELLHANEHANVGKAAAAVDANIPILDKATFCPPPLNDTKVSKKKARKERRIEGEENNRCLFA